MYEYSRGDHSCFHSEEDDLIIIRYCEHLIRGILWTPVSHWKLFQVNGKYTVDYSLSKQIIMWWENLRKQKRILVLPHNQNLADNIRISKQICMCKQEKKVEKKRRNAMH